MYAPEPNKSLTMERLEAYKIGRAWIYEHLQELQNKGWSRRELFMPPQPTENAQIAPALELAWLQPQVKATIGNNGTIFLTWPRGENKFTTMAKPIPRSTTWQDVAKAKTKTKARTNTNQKYINLEGLKRRGWTVKLIADFLPEHDKEAPNPINSDWAPQKLYHLDKVKEIEKDDLFQRRKEWANGFQARMKEVKRQERERRLKE